MKIIAFLLCFIGLVAGLQEVQTESESVIDIRHHGHIMTIIGEGFEVVRGDEHHQYRANDYVVVEQEIFVYGFILHQDEVRQYQGFLLVISSTGQVIYEEVFNEGEHMDVPSHYMLDGQLIFHVSHHHDDYDKTVDTNYFYRYEQGLLSDPIKVEGRIYRVDLVDGMLFISNHYHGDYQAAIDCDFNVYYDDIVYGIVNFGVYEDAIEVFFLNTLMHNGITYENQILFDYPGHYYLRFKEHTYQFSLYPSIIGVKDGGVYNDEVIIDVSSGHVFLNDDLYAEGEVIQGPGYYTLRIEGVNGFDHRLEFTITSNLEGVFDRQIYTSSRTLTFNGHGYLNGRYIESGYTVSEVGNYTLEIHGDNDYLETVYFEIHESDLTANQGQQLLRHIEVGFLATATLLGGGYFIHKKIKKDKHSR